MTTMMNLLIPVAFLSYIVSVRVSFMLFYFNDLTHMVFSRPYLVRSRLCYSSGLPLASVVCLSVRNVLWLNGAGCVLEQKLLIDSL